METDAADLVDTHAHLDMPPLREAVDEVLDRAARAGVRQVVAVGTDPDSSRAALDLARRHPGVYAAVGVHPHDAARLDEAAMERLAALCREEKVVAVGEIGLDFYRNRAPAELQASALRRQLALALEAGLPVILHARAADEALCAILAETAGPGLRGVVHCFTGAPETAERLVELGLHVSFTGIVTFPGAEAVREAVRAVPPDRLLVETDAPYLAPVPHRGRPNEPAFVVHVARRVGELKGMTFEEVAACTSANARALFGLPHP
ncbi:TatD family hydrolase [Dissulfurirhabdus thermomarina]|uniref:TatD family hydrolase n=1 Tax=Dissulfurirhabdus thermomarina TaxID=1765737 RepID=A0A6N9TNY5_DISTH|nr:TatD family hydrolase [Dissulfurirhabdus thermomarina]NDY42768.1 TatD family hydrolase [Dissulfurirhabdus thermomarina]NMX24109.1 TatD family hydrolase [Dissulfurirhabdus thermomarina]